MAIVARYVHYSDVETITPETADSFVLAKFSFQDEAMDVIMYA